MRTPRHRPPAAGMSLAEVLVYAVLLLVLMGGLYLTLVSALRYLSVARANQEVHQEALKASQALRAELSETRASTVSVSSDPPGILFLSARTPANRYEWDRWGRLLWQKRVAYYLEEERLVRREQALDSPTVSSRPGGVSLVDLVADSTLSERVVARGVAHLEFLGSDLVQVRLTTRSQAAQGEYRLDLRTTVRPRS